MPKENKLIPASSWPVFSFSLFLSDISFNVSPKSFLIILATQNSMVSKALLFILDTCSIISHTSVQIAVSASYLTVATVSPSNAKLQYSSNRLILRIKQATDFKVLTPEPGRLRCVVTVFAFGLGIYSKPSMRLQTINS